MLVLPLLNTNQQWYGPAKAVCASSKSCSKIVLFLVQMVPRCHHASMLDMSLCGVLTTLHVLHCGYVSAEQGWGLGFDGPSAQRLLALFLLEEIQDVSSPTLTPLPLLLIRLQQQLGQAGIVLAHALVGILRGLTSPDDIVTVLYNFSTLLAQPGSIPAVATDACSIAYIATTSPLGLFMRRVRLGLNSMSIQGLAALSEQIQQQLQQLATHQHHTAAASSNSNGALKDQAVLEAYVNQLLSAVETQGQSLPASLVEAATARLSQLELELPKLEYLRMAVSLAHKDMHAALSSLHKYFDSSGSATSGGSTAAAGPGLTASGLAAVAASKGKGKHQAALHSLSALHAALGHPQEALAALQELLRLGQQAGDEWGLLHALAGLCRVMGMSEGLQLNSNKASSSTSSGEQTAGPASWVGWGLLDLRRTEQQLQLQALLQRCLSTARDMRAPHIAAFAAVALCRFKLQHAAAASSNSSGGEAASVAVAAGAGGSSEASITAAAGASLTVQRMLLDVATLEHQAAIAAAAPSTPAVAAAPANTGGAVAPNLAARSTALYNPSEAFGTGTNTTVVTTLPAGAAAAAATTKSQPVGLGWRSSAAAVSQALATAHLAAAAALQLQGANSLAAVRLLMLLTAPGGDAGSSTAAAGPQAMQQQQQMQGTETAAFAQQHLQLAKGQGCVTGCGVRCEDIASAWALASDLIASSQGSAAADYALSLAAAHFPTVMPEQLSAAQQQLRLKRALQVQDLQVAAQCCEELQSLAHQQPQLGIEVQLAAAEADARAQAAAGCWPEAHAAAASLFAVAAASGMQPQAVKALLLMGKACVKAGDIAGALPYALSAMMHCQQLQLDALLPEAVLLVAAAWQGLAPGGSGFVAQMLQQVMPVVCGSGNLALQGELQEALGKAMLSAMQDSSNTSTDGGGAATSGVQDPQRQVTDNSSSYRAGCIAGQTADLGEVAQRLAAAAAIYEQAGCWSAACDTWMMLAHACNAVGQEQARNTAAVKWHAARQRLLVGSYHQKG